MSSSEEAGRLLPNDAIRCARNALLVVVAFTACKSTSPKPANSDSAFAAVQSRGAAVMGVDQYTSAHVFEDLPDGGRIVLERKDATDSAAVRAIHEFLAFQRMDHRAAGHSM